MRCYACDVILTPSESTRKFEKSGAFTDLCGGCLSTVAEGGDAFTATVEGAGIDDDEDLFDDDGNPIED